jgi:hypothetical protein
VSCLTEKAEKRNTGRHHPRELRHPNPPSRITTLIPRTRGLQRRELSASRMPDERELAEIADRLRRAVAPALDLPYPDPEAVRLAALAGQIALRTAGE